MPVIQGNGSPNGSPTGEVFFHRRRFVTDKDGVEHEITCDADLEKIIAQMTPEEYEKFKAQYRFCSIQNLTGNPNYTGTRHDC